MPQYSVDEVVDIVKSLTAEQQAKLRSQLSALWVQPPAPAAAKAQQSQSFGNISIGSGSSFDLNQVSADGSVDLSRTAAQMADSGQSNLSTALALLAQLKQDIHTVEELNRLEKKTAASTIELVEEELQKPKPDQGLIEHAIDALSKGLAGVEKLAAPTIRVAKLVATAMVL